MPYTKDLSLMLSAAQVAARMTLDYARGRDVKIDYKTAGTDSPVTEADMAVDAYLHETLRRARPDYGWLSEERVDDGSRKHCKRTWVVDPIDGTTGYVNFLKNGEGDTPEDTFAKHFAVSIALLENDVPVVGVIATPLNGRVFHAVRGHGMGVNQLPVKRFPASGELSGYKFLSSTSETREGLLTFLEGQVEMIPTGSSAHKSALVALMGGYVTASVKPKSLWDMAAADVMCHEAGICLTDLSGAPLTYTDTHELNGIIAAPDVVYDTLKALMPTEVLARWA